MLRRALIELISEIVINMHIISLNTERFCNKKTTFTFHPHPAPAYTPNFLEIKAPAPAPAP